MTELADRLATVQERIEAAAARGGRRPEDVRIIGVTKTHPPAVAQEAVDLGVTDLGENRVEEFVAKRERVEGAKWHFIGQLQSRKANALVGTGAVIHSVDRRSLVDRLERLAEREEVTVETLVQVNVGDDPRKGGCGLDDLDDLVAYARDRSHLTVTGLMTMPPLPPADADPAETARPVFARLRQLRDELWADASTEGDLSMGMTADLEAAVEEGATMVRVGTALFGERGPRAWSPARDLEGSW
ncbi:MAG: YggS family pyridoxal phosphate-dependent enzyme [Nitriliruptorales bacterium]|nr:YggS family pyridoxal phosphate-dependent enzyme [Nitriliruptorales bacterium]